MNSSGIEPFQMANSKHKNAVKTNGSTIIREKWATQQNNFTAIVSHLAYMIHLFLLSCSLCHTKTSHKHDTLEKNHFERKTIKSIRKRPFMKTNKLKMVLCQFGDVLTRFSFLLMIRLLYFCHHLIIYITIWREYIKMVARLVQKHTLASISASSMHESDF